MKLIIPSIWRPCTHCCECVALLSLIYFIQCEVYHSMVLYCKIHGCCGRMRVLVYDDYIQLIHIRLWIFPLWLNLWNWNEFLSLSLYLSHYIWVHFNEHTDIFLISWIFLLYFHHLGSWIEKLNCFPFSMSSVSSPLIIDQSATKCVFCYSLSGSWYVHFTCHRCILANKLEYSEGNKF